jgi:hypothetical protein
VFVSLCVLCARENVCVRESACEFLFVCFERARARETACERNDHDPDHDRETMTP